MELKENRECKNSVFVDLFYEDETAEENDIALYNALHDEPLPPGTTIGNMPLRSFLYLGRAYEQIIPVQDRYRRKLVPIPKPEIYTFYNGKEKWTKEKVLKLSDAFMIQDEDSAVELKVKVININPEQNHEVLERCRVLKDYGIFIDTIRKYQNLGGEEPYRRAIEECIEKDILADYLRKKGSEVVNMLMSEYNYEQNIEVQREEAYEEGKQYGISIAIKNMLHKGFDVAEIAEMVEVPIETVRKIKEEIQVDKG